MKNKLLFILFTALIGYGLLSNSGGRASIAMDGNTGAPGESGITCGSAGCHTGGNYGPINIVLTVTDGSGMPATSYVPGTTYTLFLQGIASGGFPAGYGFQMTALDPNNAGAGNWLNAGAGTTFGTALGRTYWEHSSPALIAGFTAEWRAPAAGKGTVSFYYIMTATNGNQIPTGDEASPTMTFMLPEGNAGCPGVTVIATQITGATCFAACNGIATAQATGGAIPYSYQWSNGASGLIASNLCRGNYTVTLTDANGCKGTATILIDEPLELTMQSSVQDASCNGVCDGNIAVIAAGGTPPYNYIYNPPNPGCAGAYSITVTDANGCITTGTATITEPPAINLAVTSTPVSMPGANDGTATANPNGGNPPFTYEWSDGQNTQTAILLPGGVICVTITDTNGCTATDCETVAGGMTNNTEIEALDAVNLYPNPARELTTLELRFKESVDVTWSVMNTFGQRVISSERQLGVQNVSKRIDLSGLAVGVYLIEVRVDDQVFSRRLLKE